LGLLGTAATYRPIVPTPGDYDVGEIGRIMIGRGKRKYSEKTCPSATLSTTNPRCSGRTRKQAAEIPEILVTSESVSIKVKGKDIPVTGRVGP
jgi:hypothetical protein